MEENRHKGKLLLNVSQLSSLLNEHINDFVLIIFG